MVAINVVIQSLEDAKNGKQLISGIQQKDITEAASLTIGILEKGMTSGKVSLMFMLKTNDKKLTVAQCSAEQFEMLIGAVRGAVARFTP